MRIAVVGGGIMGVSVARAAASRGHSVTLFEHQGLANARGSSHGRSRIVRKAYPDAFYTRLMEEAYPLWVELDEAAGGGVFHPVGLLYFGLESDPAMQQVGEALRLHQVQHSVLRESAHPELHDNEIGFLTPEAGWVHAERAVHASWQLAVQQGATWVRERVTHLQDLERQFDRVILAAGSWIRDFVPLDVQVWLMTLGYVQGRIEGPVWIEEGPNYLYGFPSEPGQESFKVGVHTRGQTVDPDAPDRIPDPISLDLIRDLAQRRFHVSDPVLGEVKTCLYTMTSDEDFRIGALTPRTYWVSACSGHGFKFGPWVGRLMVDLAEGIQDVSAYPRFAVG